MQVEIFANILESNNLVGIEADNFQARLLSAYTRQRSVTSGVSSLTHPASTILIGLIRMFFAKLQTGSIVPIKLAFSSRELYTSIESQIRAWEVVH
jgi:hypothetical protein